MSFCLSFHQTSLGRTGAHWLDRPPDASCTDSTGQHAMDGSLLSCNPLLATWGHASPDGISGDRSTVPAVVWVTEGAASHGLIIRLIIQTIRQDPSGAIWTDDPSDVSRPDPSGADQIDAEDQATDLAVAPGLS